MNGPQYFLTTSLSYQLTVARKERDELSFSRNKITGQWMDVLKDVRKEHEKETGKLKKAVAKLIDIIACLKMHRGLL